MHKTLHFLKSYRERTGILLQDMAKIIGIDTGNLSKIEYGKLKPSVPVLLGYHLILKIPIEKLMKNHYPKVTKDCLRNALKIKEQIIETNSIHNHGKRITLLDIVIDRLVELDNMYE